MEYILIIDDELAICESLVYALTRDGFKTRQAANLSEAAEYVENAFFVILDLMLPDGNGLDFLRTLRQTSLVPVIILTSRDDETDRVVGLEIGADDYVIKPFSPREIVARVRAVMRRVEPQKKPETIGELTGPFGLSINLTTRRVSIENGEVGLSKIEFDLLSVLLQFPGRVFERSELLEKVWGAACVVGERTVDVHLKSLRQKLKAEGLSREIIETVRGVGYRLLEEE
jgi:DNA-binding response OmpR family regulator